MKTDLAQTHVTAIPGQAARVEIDVTNTADVIDGVTAIVDGINPDWVRLERPLLSLFPATTDRLTVIFDVPRTCPAGDYLVVVRVVSTIDPERGSVHDFWLTVGVITGVELDLRPSIVTGGSSATVDAIIRNTGNAPAEIAVAALEPTRAVDCRLEPNRILLGHGAEALLPIVLRGPRPWFGQPAVRQVHVAVHSGEQAVEKIVTFNQKPRIARGLITALTLAGIVALWALIFLWVVSELRSDAPPAKATGTTLFTGPENIAIAAVAGEARGTVTAATTGEGIARITVEAWRVANDGTTAAVASAATDDEGVFALPSLLPGEYKLRFSADGFGEVWYTQADGSDPAVGDTVRIEPLGVADGLDVTVGGEPGTLTGKVALPPGSAAVPLTVTATLITEQSDGAGGEAPQTFSQVTTDGTINLTGLPTPATYQVTVTGPGFETQSFQQAVGGGQAGVLNTVGLDAATGTIEGTVTDPTGRALGGVEVVARSGETEYRAVTPTAGGVGAFRLIGLTTPETYVLTFTLADHSSLTLALDLPAGGSESVSAVLVGGSGTVVGSVVGPEGQPLGGVTVTVVGEDFTGETSTLTTDGAAGSAGGFTVSGLPVPSDYTITLSAPGYQSETLGATFLVAGTQNLEPVALLPVNGRIEGFVLAGGNGLGEATVTLTDGERTQATTSATSPAGAYAFADVPAGSYALTFARPGYATRVVLVEVAPGEQVGRDVALVQGGG